jgi:RNA methyltransferase, TrmH family
VVEGPELLSVALDAGAPIESVYVAPEGRTSRIVTGVVDRAFDAGIRVFDLAPGVIERISDTVTPQPVLAVVGFSPAALEDLRGATMVMVLGDVRDPGNAGTMIRTADAAGVDGVVHCEGTVDPTNPKTVRSSAGSIFHVPVVSGGNVRDVLTSLRSWGLVTVGTAVSQGTDYAALDWGQRVALVFGNEAAGLDGTLDDLLDERVTVPMVGRAESLNVAVSASVLCFEALRQRRLGIRITDHVREETSGEARPGSTISGVDAPRPDQGERDE